MVSTQWESFKRDGALEGYDVCKRLLRAVEELLSKERPAGVTVQ